MSCVALVNCSRAVLRSATIFPVPRPAMRASWGTSFLPAATRVCVRIGMDGWME